jgi:hypothetical protein
VDGEPRRWRLNAGARATLRDADVQVGETVTVRRLDDRVENGRTISDWS